MDCVGFSELDENASNTYKANFDIQDNVEMGDLVSFASDKKKMRELPDFDLLTGGFPCQSFSMMGKQAGFNDIRGNVFFQIIDILKHKKPKFVLLENVKNLVSHNRGETFKTILQELKSAGYSHIFYDIFDTQNFDLAQKRNRDSIFASSVPLPPSFVFDEKSVLKNFKSIRKKASILRQSTVLDVLQKEVDEKYYLSSTIKPTILADGSKNFKSRSEINQLVARPLTATMVKMHRACQDNYYSDEFVQSKDPIAYLERQWTKKELEAHHIRKITPQEAFALQGFDTDFFANALGAGVSNHQLYKQAGNAASVNTIYAILHHLFAKEKVHESVL
jgi:DNA (cytosine-5)-methyltransferase 1